MSAGWLIEFTPIEDGHTVMVGERFADRLGPDEALGVVAGVLMDGRTPYLHTYKAWVNWQRRYTMTSDPYCEDAPALEDLRVRAPVLTARGMGVVRRTFDQDGNVVNRFVTLRGAR